MRRQAIYQVEVCDTCSSVSETVLYCNRFTAVESVQLYIKLSFYISFIFYLHGKRKDRKIRDDNHELIFFYFRVRY